MSKIDGPHQDRWLVLLDADIDRIFAGDQPHNTELTSSVSPITDLRAMGFVELDEEHVSDMTGRATELVPPPVRRTTEVGQVRGFAGRLRTRATAGATTLIVVSGLAGVAVASDDAVPGDWNYGIDRALEAIGIGDGGAAERLIELRALEADQPPTLNAAIARRSELTADQVLAKGSEASHAAGEKVSAIHEYLASTEKADGSIVSEIARDMNREARADHAEAHGPPEHAQIGGRPDHAKDRGRPDHAGDRGRPDHANEQGRPDHDANPEKPSPGANGKGKAKGRK